MRLTAGELRNKPTTALGSGCLVFGAEPLLIEESCDFIRDAARADGIDERIGFMVQARPKFDWNQLDEMLASGSLFATRRLIELRLMGAGPGTQGAQYLTDYFVNPAPGVTLMVICGAIDKRSQNTKWFKAIEKAGVVIDHNQVKRAQLPRWLTGRLKAEGLTFDQAVVDRLAYLLEGNLLAAAQEVRKLRLLFGHETGNSKVTEADVNQALADHARFDVFSYVDCCLAGELPRALRILDGLQREGVDPILILWSLSRECRAVVQVAWAKQQGEAAGEVFRRLRIWQSRESLIRKAVGRHDLAQWQSLMQRLDVMDRMLKGREAIASGATLWEELARISAELTGHMPVSINAHIIAQAQTGHQGIVGFP